MERRTLLKLAGAATLAGAVGSTTLPEARATETARTVRMGPFLLVNPPEGQEQVLRAAYDAMSFPWELLDPVVDADSDRAVLVEWDDTGQGVSGLFYGGSLRIVLSRLDRDLDAGAAFVFAHEVGHLVDRCVLTDQARAQLMQLMHTQPYVQLGHFNHDHQDAGHATEAWTNNGDAYVSRVHECYADQWVAAFAPSVWDGTVLPDAGQRWPRFVHWTEDHAAVRRITLEAAVPEPEPEPELRARSGAPGARRWRRRAAAE